MRLRRLQQDWNELAKLDPLYAICTNRSKRGNRWKLAPFFRSGQKEIDSVVTYLKVRAPDIRFSSALDFGCGVGRLTTALAEYWIHAIGVDISEEMLCLAIRYRAKNSRCHFVLNNRSNLACFQDNSFDLIYSNITLMHLPYVSTIEKYVREFVRLLKPGGYMLFHLPTHIPVFRRIKLRRPLYYLLESCGISPSFLYYRLKLHPIKITPVPKSLVVRWLSPETQLIEVVGVAGPTTRYLAQKRRKAIPSTA